MENLKRILAAHEFFRDLSDAQLDILEGCAANVRFEKGEYLLREGQDADRFFLIRSGRVAVETYGPRRGAIQIQSLTAGDVLGWSWLVPPYRWHFDARALERTRALTMDGVCLRGKCDENRELGYELMKRLLYVMEERLKATRLQLLDLYRPAEGGR